MKNTTKTYEVQPAAVFLAGLQNRYNKAKILYSFYENEWKALVKKWDGKIYNKRFRDAVTNALKEKNPLMFMSEEYSFSKEEKKISLSSQVSEFNYNTEETFCLNLFLTEDGRIDAEKTLSGNDNRAEAFQNNMEVMCDTIQHYYVYMEEVQRLYEAILGYNKLPYMFRQNIKIQKLIY